MRKFLIAILMTASPAFAAGDWSQVYSNSDFSNSQELYEFRTDSVVTSEALDTRQCKGTIGVRWDPSVTDSSSVATGWLLGCDTSAQPSSECRRLVGFGSDSWVVGDVSAALNTSEHAFLRVFVNVAPTGGDVAAVQVDCRKTLPSPVEVGDVSARDDINRTHVNFQDVRHTSCNNAACTPNDSLTPFWLRSAIGAAVADTFALATAYQETGSGIIDPGTSNTTGVQYSLPASQSLNLLEASRLKYPFRRFYLRATVGRSGTNNVLAVGLCGIVPSTATVDPLITTAGAFTSTGEFIGVKWNTDGTMAGAFRGSTSGIRSSATTESFDQVNYHEITIRSLVRNVGLDSGGGLDLGGQDSADRGIVIEVDGVVLDTISDDDTGLPSLSSKQLTPCVAAVNSGGTADTAYVFELIWETDRLRALADTN